MYEFLRERHRPKAKEQFCRMCWILVGDEAHNLKYEDREEAKFGRFSGLPS